MKKNRIPYFETFIILVCNIALDKKIKNKISLHGYWTLFVVADKVSGYEK